MTGAGRHNPTKPKNGEGIEIKQEEGLIFNSDWLD
jgi:hypothetical protein